MRKITLCTHISLAFAVLMGTIHLPLIFPETLLAGDQTSSSDTTSIGRNAKSSEKMNQLPGTRKSHRLIKKSQGSTGTSQSAPITVTPIQESSPAPSTLLLPTQLESTASPSKETQPAVKGSTTPVASGVMTIAPSAGFASGAMAGASSPNSTLPIAAAGGGSNGSNGKSGGRSLQSLAASTPGLVQLIAPPPPPPPVITSTPVIGSNPASLAFIAQQGGGNPAAQTLTISNTGGGTLTWTASEGLSWLSVSPASGTGNGTITVSATTGSMAAGNYTGSISLTAPGATTVMIPVSFAVTAAPVPPAIGVSPTSLSFTAQQGGGNPAAQTLTISNTGGGTLTWTASEGLSWLSVSPASGTGNGTITVSATTGSMAAGNYTGSISLTAPGATTVMIPVSFAVTAAPVPPAIGVSPTSLSFTAQQGGSNPAARTVNVSNTGGGTLNWSVSGGATWLSFTPSNGIGNGTISFTAATGTLTAGNYNATVTISAPGATSVNIPVSFTVTASPTIGLSPTTFSFTGVQGGANPGSKTLNITNPGTGTLSWSVSDNASWLTLSPTSGSTTTGSSPVVLSVNTAGLVAGSFSATITVTATGATNTPQTVSVSLTVTAPTTTTATLFWDPVSDPSLAGYRVYQRTDPGTYPASPTATVAANQTSYTATGTQGVRYCFTVTAIDAAGNESTRPPDACKVF